MINERGHIDDNGFVSQYWYDADGERTVKTSGDGTVVYVNSLFSGGNTQTAKFTLYVSPYLVASQGGKYTKHIYVGSQRIVSKLGDLQSYGADPRRIPYAGSESDNINVDYKGKYTSQQQSIKNNYTAFDVLYNGKDNDNYADGQGFCCEAPSDSPHGGGLRSLTPGQNDNYEQAQFYYHPDHLGSSSFITNLDGDVTQHIEYVPFGEVFIEERNNVWNTPYLFNAKELEEETGLYYYGARYYDSRVSLWLSVDPISSYDPRNTENYLDGDHNGGVYNSFNTNVYIYCCQNPIKLADPNGKQVIAVHGTWSNNTTWKDTKGISAYSNKEFRNNFANYSFYWSGGNYAKMRTAAAKKLVQHIMSIREKVPSNEPITLVGHSHGGNVSIEAINMMIEMDEFKDVKFNLLTINTPVRSDYQLSEKAQKKVTHVNVYDPKDPVQSNGGNGLIILPDNQSSVFGTGEYGSAGRKFHNAKNIEVDNPQGFINGWSLKRGVKWGDYHNSHNRTNDWSKKTTK